jgi:DNA-directed RNA polymerase specialized sigma24 family protein
MGNDLEKGGIGGGSGGGGPTQDEHLLIGSIPWQDKMERRAEAKGKRRVEVKELQHIIEWAGEMEEPDRINSGIETETGKALHHTLINHIEIAYAIYHLPTTMRWCVIHRHWEGKGIYEIARGYEMTEESVRKALSRAYERLALVVYDRGAA